MHCQTVDPGLRLGRLDSRLAAPQLGGSAHQVWLDPLVGTHLKLDSRLAAYQLGGSSTHHVWLDPLARTHLKLDIAPF